MIKRSDSVGSPRGTVAQEERSPVLTPLRAIAVAVDSGDPDSLWCVNDSIDELRVLAKTASVEVVASVTQKLPAPLSRTYVGSGKAREIADLVREQHADLVVCDDELSPVQQRNLERELGCEVMDRTGLILAVFARRAQTKEGRLQVELAQHQYLLSRLTRQWTHLSRQYGAIGARGGPGETQLEIDRRQAKRRISELARQIEKVRVHRHMYRAKRADEGVPVVALVGYTNSGKSTLLGALSGADVVAEDKLFATLDPLTRRVKLPSGGNALVSDTVGFIQKLPPTLVAAFRATLEELDEADVLVHVVDITHRRGYEQAATVDQLLRDLGLADKPRVTAVNKIDLLQNQVPPRIEAEALEDDDAEVEPIDPAEALRQVVASYPNGVAVSALSGAGLDDLVVAIENVLSGSLVSVSVMVPYNAGSLANMFREKAKSVRETSTVRGTLLTGMLAPRFLSAFEAYRTRETA